MVWFRVYLCLLPWGLGALVCVEDVAVLDEREQFG
jgi:hypothetical protein